MMTGFTFLLIATPAVIHSVVDLHGRVLFVLDPGDSYPQRTITTGDFCPGRVVCLQLNEC